MLVASQNNMQGITSIGARARRTSRSSALVRVTMLLSLCRFTHAGVPDVTPPTITTCAPPVTVEVGPACSAAMPDLTSLVVATDDSGSVTISQFPPAGVGLGIVAFQVTLTATDPSGNSTSCSTAIVVVDHAPPVITSAPSDVTIGAGSLCSVLMPDLLGSFAATDACGTCTLSQSPSAGASLALGMTTVAFVARDASGNEATASAVVTVDGADSDLDGILDCSDACPLGRVALAARINEIRLHHAGTDDRELIEIAGAPNASLGCALLLIVDGDGLNAGTLDRVIDLSGRAFSPSGFFVLGDSAVPQRDIDLGSRNTIENGTCTFYLVSTNGAASLVALVGTNVAIGPRTTVIQSLCLVVDVIGVADAGFPARDVVFDGANVLGPDGPFVPAGVFRCANAPFEWSASFLGYEPIFGAPFQPTPGAANDPCDPGHALCLGDGSGTMCPCGNDATLGERVGCRNSTGKGAELVASGFASLSADDVVLSGAQMPDGPASYFQGSALENAGLGSVFGDGLRCAGGTVIRLGTTSNVAGASALPAPFTPTLSTRGLITSPRTVHYQILYRNSQSFCTSATFNATNAWTTTWSP